MDVKNLANIVIDSLLSIELNAETKSLLELDEREISINPGATQYRKRVSVSRPQKQ